MSRAVPIRTCVSRIDTSIVSLSLSCLMYCLQDVLSQMMTRYLNNNNKYSFGFSKHAHPEMKPLIRCCYEAEHACLAGIDFRRGVSTRSFTTTVTTTTTTSATITATTTTTIIVQHYCCHYYHYCCC